MINILSIGERLTEIIKDAFGVNFTELVINLIATILLILIVRFYFWNKITAFLDKRKEKLKSDYEASEDLKAEAEKIKDDAIKELNESKLKASQIIDEAKRSAAKQKENIISSAKRDAQEIVSKSRIDAQEEKDEILKSAKDEIVDIASLMASKIIESEIDQKRYNKKVLDELEEKEK